MLLCAVVLGNLWTAKGKGVNLFDVRCKYSGSTQRMVSGVKAMFPGLLMVRVFSRFHLQGFTFTERSDGRILEVVLRGLDRAGKGCII